MMSDVVSLLPVALAAATSLDAGPRPGASFGRDIAPVLERWCVRCHGGREQGGGLRLDSYEALMRGGDSGPPVIPGDPAGSLLVAKVERRSRPAMPPRGRLPKALVARLRAWIQAGAPP